MDRANSSVVPLSLRTLPLGACDAAAEMLAQRQRLHRAAWPVLAHEFESPQRCRQAIEPLLKGSVAVGASRDRRLVGFLAATVDATFGLVPAAGHAVDTAEPDPGDVYGLMYAELADRLVARDVLIHDVVIPAIEPIENAWYDLGFGRRVCIASRPTQDDELRPLPKGILVREARRDELETVARLSSLEVEYRAGSPMFTQGGPPDLDAIRASHEALANTGAVHLLAELEGKHVGLLTLEIESRFSPICSENGLFVGPSATDPGFRRRGVASALLASALDWARRHGYPHMDVSFMSANLPSRKFWRRAGFVDIGWKLARRLPGTLAHAG